MRRVAPLLTALILFSNLSEVLAQQKIVKPEVLEVYESRTFQDMPYRLMKPIDLADHPERAYPLVLSLHGGKGRGTDNVKNLESWTRVMADEEWRRAYPSIVVAPQAQGRWLEPGMVPELTEKEIKGFPEALPTGTSSHSIGPTWRLTWRLCEKTKSLPPYLGCLTSSPMNSTSIQIAFMYWDTPWAAWEFGTHSISNRNVSPQASRLPAGSCPGLMPAAFEMCRSGVSMVLRTTWCLWS